MRLGALEGRDRQLESARTADVLDILGTPRARCAVLFGHVNDFLRPGLEHSFVAAESQQMLHGNLPERVGDGAGYRGHESLVQAALEERVYVIKRPAGTQVEPVFEIRAQLPLTVLVSQDRERTIGDLQLLYILVSPDRKSVV